MRLQSINIQNIRSHESYAVEFHDRLTVITGSNGAGKTSIVEALYISLQGKSFRGTDKDIMRSGAEWYRIDVSHSEGSRTVRYEPAKSRMKTHDINNRSVKRLSARDKYPIILFEPDDLRLLQGSPQRRREFLDRIITQYDPLYATALRRYERVLKQRNVALKQPHTTPDDVFVWNVALAKYGEQIYEARKLLVEYLNQYIQGHYREIAQNEDTVDISYLAGLRTMTSGALLSALEQSLPRDLVLGYTSVGPHRDDIMVRLNRASAADTASRGELRTIVLALKFIESELIEHKTDRQPIIILDDVFGELDKQRQSMLMRSFRNHQIIMTTVDTRGHRLLSAYRVKLTD